MTTTSPGCTARANKASTAASSKSNTRAGPTWTCISTGTEKYLTTAPPGARLPRSTAMPPSGPYGSDRGPSAGVPEVPHRILAGGLGVSQHRHAAVNAVEVIDGDVDAHLTGNRRQ